MSPPEILYSPETEKALLGCILIDSETLTGLDVRTDDFYIDRNKMIWRAIDHLRNEDCPVDYITVCQELDRRKQLAEIDGPAYVMGLISMEATAWNAPAYAKILRDKARRRGLVQIANQIAKEAYDETSELDQALPSFVDGIVNAAQISAGARPLSDYMSELYDQVDERVRNPADVWGIPTGFASFDKITGGLQNGELFILSGVPGVGKSMLAMQMGIQLAKHAPGAIYSMEMSGLQVARRLVSGKACIPTRALKTGRMKEEDIPVFTSMIEEFSNLPVFLSDGSGWTTTSLRADLARLKAKHKIQWFILDYLYLLNDAAGQDEIERTQIASKGLKRATRELDIAGIAVHSMNKSGMATNGASVPTQDQLRGSGQVIYDADLIGFITKYDPDLDDDPIPMQYRNNVRVLWFGKGRELEDPHQYVRLVQKTNPKAGERYPAFTEYAPEDALP